MAAINPGIRVTETKNSCTDKTIFLSSRNCVKSIWNLVNKASLNDEATIAYKENDQLTSLLVRGCNLMSTTVIDAYARNKDFNSERFLFTKLV